MDILAIPLDKFARWVYKILPLVEEMAEGKAKREGGQLAEDGNWLVLSESKVVESEGELKG